MDTCPNPDVLRFNDAIALLRTNQCAAAQDVLKMCQTAIPQQVFEAALESKNLDFVYKNIERSGEFTKHNILDQAILSLNVDLAQHIMSYVSANTYPFLTAVIRVYKSSHVEPMLEILTPHLTTTEKMILARGLVENLNPRTPLTIHQVQERVNILTQEVAEHKMLSTIASCSVPRTKEVLTAALNYHQNRRLHNQLSAPEISRYRKL